MYSISHKQGFTLLEILMVVAAIGILTGITVVAINPGRQLAKARNQTRTADVNTIRNALKEYSLDNQGQVPDGITGKLKNICQSDASSCSTNSDRVNLSVIEQYLAEEALPVDPKKSDGATLTGYQVAVSAQGNYKVTAPNAENNETIAVGPDNLDLLLLDEYSGAAAAYSVRRLTNGYDGPALTIRRGSDDETSDIGFQADGDLDTGAIQNFCGTSNCYVKTWHDQSVNDNDATNSTKSEQPQIYDGSSVITENSKPALDFDGVDDTFKIKFSSSPIGTLSVFSVFTEGASSAGTDTSFYGLVKEGDESQGLFYGIYSVWRERKPEGDSSSGYPGDGLLTLLYRQSSGNGLEKYRNGSLFDKVADSNVGGVYDTFAFAARPRGDGTIDAYGKTFYQELIIYSSDQSSNRSGIESNINDYYSIY